MKSRRLPLGDKNIIGAQVTEVRKKRRMTHKELMAQMQVRGVNIPYSSLSKLEGQTRAVNDKELIVLCDIFGVDMNFWAETEE